MEHLDLQMRRWSPKLRDDLKISPVDSNQLATVISAEVTALDSASKQLIKQASPFPLNHRIDELIAFQGWMDLTTGGKIHPAIARAQVIAQNYICFVYLGESCFRVLKKVLPSGSSSKKCCSFLTDNPVRAFRNAIAHANWKYKDDFSGLEYWARKGDDPKEELVYFGVSQEKLNFWQALSRCVAYAAFTNL
jgi:hypothetical protein